jgi:hypothetical protein
MLISAYGLPWLSFLRACVVPVWIKRRAGERMRMLCDSTEAIETEFKKGSRERDCEIKQLRSELSTLKAALESVSYASQRKTKPFQTLPKAPPVLAACAPNLARE